MTKKTFSVKIEEALREQGRSKKWLAGKLGILPSSLSIKLKSNTFDIANVYFISQMLDIKE